MFNVGDYVEVDFTNCYDVPSGIRTQKLDGVVVCGRSEQGRIGVQFSVEVGGHGCGGCREYGFCWWVDGCYIKKTKSKTIFIKSLNIEVYMQNKRYYYADNHKEITDKCVLFKIIKELTMKGVEIY